MGRLADGIRSFWLGERPSRDPALAKYFGYAPVSSGVPVTTEAVTGLAAVWACVTLIAGTIASMPLCLYKRRPDGGREKFTDHPLFDLLDSRPNPEQPAQAFKESIVASLLLRGVAYAEIERDMAARVRGLWCIHPDRVSIGRRPSGALFYRVSGPTKQVELDDDDVLRITGPMSDDGLTGRSVISAAREVFGTALALEKYAGSFFANAATPNGVLSVPGRLSPEASNNLRAAWQAAHTGGQSWHKTVILEDNAKFEPISLSNDDAEFLAARRFSTEEIARLFLCPPHLIGATAPGSLTYANAESRNQDLLTYTFGPWMRRIEDAMNRSLISSLERRVQYVEFLDAALLRADTASRFAAYKVALDGGWLTPNEVRLKENMNPLPEAEAIPTPSTVADREVVRATFQTIAGQFVRREFVFLEKVAGHPMGADEKLAVFYEKWTFDLMSHMRPWIQRLRPGTSVESAMQTALTKWSATARTQCQQAVRAGGLSGLVRRWKVERQELLTLMLLQAIDE